VIPEVPVTPVLYTQAGCAESAKVRTWLIEHDISFTERDASADADAAENLAATGTFATPLLAIGPQNVLGFRPETLLSILGTNPKPR
jgi:glutaredoxin